MSDMFSSDITKADSLQISAVFGFINSEYQKTVVKRALDSRSKVGNKIHWLNEHIGQHQQTDAT